jgi:hypothetical protein
MGLIKRCDALGGAARRCEKFEGVGVVFFSVDACPDDLCRSSVAAKVPCAAFFEPQRSRGMHAREREPINQLLFSFLSSFSFFVSFRSVPVLLKDGRCAPGFPHGGTYTPHQKERKTKKTY